MALNADEITTILERELAGYEADVDLAEVGTVVTVGDGIARVYGLQKCMAGEMLAFPHGGHDDFVDMLSLIGLGLDRVRLGRGPTRPKRVSSTD